MGLITACFTCGQLQRLEVPGFGYEAFCTRCGSLLEGRKKQSRIRTAAFSLGALFLYFPANVFPILKMDLYGVYSESTIWEGCVRLFRGGTWPVAVIVFCASIMIPFLKLAGLLALVGTARSERHRKARTRIYRWIVLTGPWAMLDVFLLSVLVAIVKLEQIATILPGPGIIAFAAMVVLTILASSSFDPRLIWDRAEDVE